MEEVKYGKKLIQAEDIQTKDLGDGVVEVIVSTNSLDRHNEKLSIKGLDIKNYNGVVLLNHDYESLPIGRSIKLKKSVKDGKEILTSQTQFAIDQYPLANTVYKLVRDGFMTDVSIGFIPQEWDSEESTWTKSEMIEYSFVTVGANRDAKVTSKAFEKIGVTEKEFEDEVVDFVKKNREAQLKMVTTEIEDEDEAELKQNTKAIVEVASALEKSISKVSEDNGSNKPAKKKKLVLVMARKKAQALDQLVELVICELKKRI
jgi:HK97 family phage prohead protease